MALTGPQKIPFASQKYYYGDKYPGSAMESNVGVIHTTEGTTLPSYGGGVSAPNVTAVPDIKAQKLLWYQHFDVDRSSRALVNRSGGVETNTLNAFQVELVGTCDPAHKTSWGSKKAGVDYIFWPAAPDWALKELAKLVRWLADNHRVPARSSVVWKSYPTSYGASSVRLSGSQWSDYYGWLGHQHVPENDHGDPGNINFARVLEHANAQTPAPPAPPKEKPVALSDNDVKRIVDGVWGKQFESPTDADGPLRPASAFLRWEDQHTADILGAIKALTDKVAALEAKLANVAARSRKAAE